MKLTLTLLFTALSFIAFGQKVRYLNENFVQVNFKEKATYYTETVQDGPEGGTVKTYTLQGVLVSDERFSNIKRQILHGLCRHYYPDGKVKAEVTYQNGILDGPLRTFYPNQKLKRVELHDKGNFVHGKCFAKDGTDTTHYDFLQRPQFKGGEQALNAYLIKSSRYPMVPVTEDLVRKGFITYNVVRFAVSASGQIKDVVIYRSMQDIPALIGPRGALYDREAIRILNQMPAWEPAKQDGENISSQHTLMMGFKL